MLTIEMLKETMKYGIDERKSINTELNHDDIIEYTLYKFEKVIEEIIDYARTYIKKENDKEYKFTKSVISFVNINHPIYASGEYDGFSGVCSLSDHANIIYQYIQDNQLISKEITFTFNEKTLEFNFCWE